MTSSSSLCFHLQLDPFDHDGCGPEYIGDGPEYISEYDDVLLMNLGLSGHQILVGVAISLLLFLPSQFVQLLFRRSKVSVDKFVSLPNAFVNELVHE